MTDQDFVPTHDDLAIDVPAELRATAEAIAYLEARRQPVPAEALLLRGIMRRCVRAEAEVQRLRDELDEWRAHYQEMP